MFRSPVSRHLVMVVITLSAFCFFITVYHSKQSAPELRQAAEQVGAGLDVSGRKYFSAAFFYIVLASLGFPENNPTPPSPLSPRNRRKPWLLKRWKKTLFSCLFA